MKCLYRTLLTLLLSAFVLLLVLFWHREGFMRHVLLLNHWQTLVADIDHRMKPGEESGLNSDNIRAPREAEAIQPGDFNVVFLGDSFVFGFFLEPEQAPPAQLEALLRAHYGTDRIHVWNFGWISSSPYLSLRLLRDLGPRYRPDLVLLNLDMTDFKDDFFYRSVIERRGHYRYLDRYPQLFFHIKELTNAFDRLNPLHQRWFGYPAKGTYFVAHQPRAQSLTYFDLVQDSLAQIHAHSRDTWQAPFVAFFPPRHWQYTDREALDSWEFRRGQYQVQGPYALEPFRYFEQAAPGLPYPFVPLLDDFRDSGLFPLHFDKDSHWNAAGARFFAERVFAHCQRLGCFEALERRLGEAGGTLAPTADLP